MTISKSTKSREYLKSESIIYSAPYFVTMSGEEIGLTHLFYVKLKRTLDEQVLIKFARLHNVEVVGNNKFMPIWYTLSCSKKSTGNALEMANLFYESGLFDTAEPDFLIKDEIECVNDQYFGNQWALTKMEWCAAQSLTTGCPDVTIAVLDQGIELNHPDFSNILPLSYDTETNSSPSVVRGNHGTACAGIIGANSNNSIGISGIAPNARLMSISNSLAGTPNSRQKRARGQ